MTSAWRWRFGGAVLLLLFAVWSVLPNFIEPKGWLSNILPDTKVQLGLDLQGGIQMTVGVDLDRALLNESDRFVRDLGSSMQEESIAYTSITRDFSSTRIEVILQNQDGLSRFKEMIRKRFYTALEIKTSNGAKKQFVVDIPEERQDMLKQEIIQQALETLRNRLDEFGVAEPSIQAKGVDKIVIQLPGMADPDRAREILAKTAQLEFKIVDDRSMSALELEKLVERSRKDLGPDLDPEELNYKIKDLLPPGTEVLFEEVTDSTTNETRNTPYLLIRAERISGDLLDDARIGVDQFNRPVVNVAFNSEGTRQFDKLTGKNVGNRLAIILDNVVKSAPVLNEHITRGEAQISLGSFRPRNEIMKEATDLALVLRAGALPAPIEILGTQAVGPSLGKDSIEKGLNAMKWGALIIFIFMILYYRASGIIADVAFGINILFILACLGQLNATLTLPGLAGILVSIGISADANIIIFERIREELLSGKSVKAAIETAYERAHLTIVDSNLTTVITGVVLFEFGTGAIKGFAITLIFGLIANYITALWFSKLVYDWWAHQFQPKTLSV